MAENRPAGNACEPDDFRHASSIPMKAVDALPAKAVRCGFWNLCRRSEGLLNKFLPLRRDEDHGAEDTCPTFTPSALDWDNQPGPNGGHGSFRGPVVVGLAKDRIADHRHVFPSQNPVNDAALFHKVRQAGRRGAKSFRKCANGYAIGDNFTGFRVHDFSGFPASYAEPISPRIGLLLCIRQHCERPRFAAPCIRFGPLNGKPVGITSCQRSSPVTASAIRLSSARRFLRLVAHARFPRFRFSAVMATSAASASSLLARGRPGSAPLFP